MTQSRVTLVTIRQTYSFKLVTFNKHFLINFRFQTTFLLLTFFKNFKNLEWILRKELRKWIFVKHFELIQKSILKYLIFAFVTRNKKWWFEYCTRRHVTSDMLDSLLIMRAQGSNPWWRHRGQWRAPPKILNSSHEYSNTTVLCTITTNIILLKCCTRERMQKRVATQWRNSFVNESACFTTPFIVALIKYLYFSTRRNWDTIFLSFVRWHLRNSKFHVGATDE